MPRPNPFKFGAKASTAGSMAEWARLARRAEDAGFYSFQIDDHLPDQLAPMPAIMAAAGVTRSIRVGPHVAGVDFRNPVVFAKECATVDLLSGGRFLLGMGAGWNNSDYDITGIQHDSAAIRIDRLAEATEVIRGLWGPGPFSFEGAHYRVASTDGQPKPASPIPLMIGGGGTKILTLAARTADVVGINPKFVGGTINPRSLSSGAADIIDEKIALVKDVAGDRFDRIELQLQVWVTRITDTPQEAAERLAPRFGLTPEFLLASPYFQIGSVEAIAESFVEARERWGFSSFTFMQSATESVIPIVEKLSGS